MINHTLMAGYAIIDVIKKNPNIFKCISLVKTDEFI